MAETLDGFSSGRYHTLYNLISETPIHKRYIKGAYQRALNLVKEQGWNDQYSHDTPHVLLCGAGSGNTANAFVEFSQCQNPSTQVTILDLHSYPLRKAQTLFEVDSHNEQKGIHLICANALQMPFRDNSFTGIETDFFLGFFPTREKAVVVNEWARILQAGGIITTRCSTSEQRTDNVFKNVTKRILKTQTYKSSLQELEELFTAAGLQVHFEQLKVASRILAPSIQHIIARKP